MHAPTYTTATLPDSGSRWYPTQISNTTRDMTDAGLMELTNNLPIVTKCFGTGTGGMVLLTKLTMWWNKVDGIEAMKPESNNGVSNAVSGLLESGGERRNLREHTNSNMWRTSPR